MDGLERPGLHLRLSRAAQHRRAARHLADADHARTRRVAGSRGGHRDVTAPRPTSTSAGPPRGRGPAWERPGARPADVAVYLGIDLGTSELKLVLLGRPPHRRTGARAADRVAPAAAVERAVARRL